MGVILGFLTAFCLLFVEMLRFVRRLEGSDASVIAAVLWTAPAAYHVAAVALTFDHSPALHVYLLIATAVALLFTAGPRLAGSGCPCSSPPICRSLVIWKCRRAPHGCGPT